MALSYLRTYLQEDDLLQLIFTLPVHLILGRRLCIQKHAASSREGIPSCQADLTGPKSALQYAQKKGLR